MARPGSDGWVVEHAPLAMAPPTRAAHSGPQVEHVRKWERDYVLVSVPYATNRAARSDLAPRDRASSAQFFTFDVSPTLNYGVANVAVPKSHVPGELESPGWFSRWDPKKHVSLLWLDVATEEKFLERLALLINSQAASSGDDAPSAQDLLLFVHGFNNDFETAARKVAQIIYDTRFPGTPLLFSWPAAAVRVPTATDFREDLARAGESLDTLKTLLKRLRSSKAAGTLPYRKVHIVAHSLGTRLVSQAVQQLYAEEPEQFKRCFGHIILAAPAIDARTFLNFWVKDILSASECLSVMASSSDYALKMMHVAEPPPFTFPLGYWTKNQFAIPEGAHSYDMSQLGGSWLDHDTYSSSSRAVQHIGEILKAKNLLGPTELKAYPYLAPLTALDFFSGLSRPYWFFKD